MLAKPVKKSARSPRAAIPPEGQEAAARLLRVIARHIVPRTREGVARGDKVFGAAVVRADSLRVVVAETNAESSSGCPLWHGEMNALRAFFALRRRPPPSACALLSTHEPCPMCAAAAAWCGMTRVYYLFGLDDTARRFAIPHDINILRALFPPAQRLARRNRFFRAQAIVKMVGGDAGLKKEIARLTAVYDSLSNEYQKGKAQNDIPLK